MNTNPYSPPSSLGNSNQALTSRALASRRVRWAVFLLLIPAFYNLAAITFPPAWHFRVMAVPLWLQVLNCLAFATYAVLIWWLALPVLEVLTSVIHAVVSRKATTVEWKESLYESLQAAPLVASLGALVWMCWIVAFYMLGLDYFLVTIPAAIVGNVLGAMLYIPLLRRWYGIERQTN